MAEASNNGSAAPRIVAPDHPLLAPLQQPVYSPELLVRGDPPRLILPVQRPVYTPELPSAQEPEYKKLEMLFNGAWIPDVDPLLVGSGNYADLQNLRYANVGLEGVSGYTALTTVALPKIGIRNLVQFLKVQSGTPTSYLLLQGTAAGASAVYQHTAVVPAAGEFTATALWSDASGAGLGRFALGPDGVLAYCNGLEATVWGTTRHRAAAVINFAYTGSETFRLDLTTQVQNASVTSSYLTALVRDTNGSDVSLLIGSTRPIQGITFTVATPNNAASTTVVYYWNGTTWTAVSSFSDGTAAGGVSLAQSGTMSFTSTVTTAKVKWEDQRLLYFYVVNVGATGTPAANTIKLSQVTVDTPWQPIVDVWDGVERQPILCTVNGQDFTLDVLETSSSAAPIGAEVQELTAGQEVVLLFEERMFALQITMAADNVNTTANTLTLSVWSGSAWTTQTTTDGTSSSSISLAQSGTVTWPEVSPLAEATKTIAGRTGYAYRLTWSAGFTSSASTDPLGAVLTIQVNSGGEDYVVGGTGGINGGSVGGYGAGYTIDTVDGDGAILTLHVNTTGQGYSPMPEAALNRNNATTGENASVDILTVATGDTTSTSDAVILDTITGIPAQRWSAVTPVEGYTFPFSFAGRIFLAGLGGGAQANRLDYCAPGRPDVWNGEQSSDRGKQIYVGDARPVTAALEMTNRYFSQLQQLTVVCKASQTWVLDGAGPESFTLFLISDSVGCPAPLSMVRAEVPSSAEGQTLRNVLLWCSQKGPMIFDGTVLLPMRFPVPGQDQAISSVDCYFTPSDSRYVNTALWERVVAYYDPLWSEYNLLLPSGSSATACNVWLVCDLKRRRWCRKVPSVYPQAVTTMQDLRGTTYGYGGIETGHLLRLDYGNTWSGTDITHVVQTADIPPSGSVFDESLARYLRVAAIRDSGSGTVTIGHAMNGSGSFTTQTTLTLAGSGRYGTVSTAINRRAFSHQWQLSCATNDAARAPRLLGMAVEYIIEREIER